MRRGQTPAAPVKEQTTQVAWLDEAAKAIAKVAQEPVFPGDPNPVLPLLEKLVTKLYGECWNGQEIGTDGCPPCRAMRTERAEAAAAAAVAEKDAACLSAAATTQAALDQTTRALAAETARADKEAADAQELRGQLDVALTTLRQLEATVSRQSDALVSSDKVVASLRAELDAANDVMAEAKKRADVNRAILQGLTW